MWSLIVRKWDSFVLSIGSMAYGLQLFTHPNILENYEIYMLLNQMFDARFISIVFILLGFMKFLGILLNNRRLKKCAVVLLSGFWMLFASSFLLSEPPNTVWIFALCMFSLSFGIALKEN